MDESTTSPIPNEMLLKIIDHLDPEDILNARLINRQWFLSSNSYIRSRKGPTERFTVRIANQEQLIDFNQRFSSCLDFPFCAFDFSFWKMKFESNEAPELKWFGSNVASRVIELTMRAEYKEPDDPDSESASKQYVVTTEQLNAIRNEHQQRKFEQKMVALLKFTTNLEKLKIKSSYEIGPTNFPLTLTKLKNLVISNERPNPTLTLKCPSLLMELVKISGISSYHISTSPNGLPDEQIDFNRKLIRALGAINQVNPKAEVSLGITFALLHDQVIDELVPCVSQTNKLKLNLYHSCRFGRENVGRFGRAVSRLLDSVHLNLSKLRISTSCMTTIRLVQVFPNLRDLELHGSLFVPFKAEQFPNVEKICLYGYSKSLFDSCVLPKVKYLLLKVEDDDDEISDAVAKPLGRAFPNLDELVVQNYCTKDLVPVLKYVQARIINIEFCFHEDCHVGDEWDLLTGGAKVITDLELKALQVETADDSLKRNRRGRGLKILTKTEELSLGQCSLDAVRSLIFLAKTDQILKLNVLNLDVCTREGDTEEVAMEYFEQLKNSGVARRAVIFRTDDVTTSHGFVMPD